MFTGAQLAERQYTSHKHNTVWIDFVVLDRPQIGYLAH
jgi:hypothetical protein